MKYNKKILFRLLIILGVFLLNALHVNASTQNIKNDLEIELLDGGGSPITTQQTLRFTLWGSQTVESGDITAAGAINTSATNYGSYQTSANYTPDGIGVVDIYLPDLSSFPTTLSSSNDFLQIEYKAVGQPDTSYQVYDPSFDSSDSIDRMSLRKGFQPATTTLDAGSKTTTDTFILDSDNSGGDITLQFGETLNEALKWDNANTRFVFTDDLRVEGNQAIIGGTFIANDHSAANSDGNLSLGRSGGNWEQIRWDSTDNRYEISDDLQVDGDIRAIGNDLILNDNDSAGDIAIHFGDTLNEQLLWDTSDSQFVFTDDVSLQGNELKNFRVENAAAAPVCNNSTKGREYFDTTTNKLMLCDGTSWVGPSGASISSYQVNALADGVTRSISHSSDPNNERILQILETITSPTETDNSLDFDTADEANYTQEDSANGTEFIGGLVRLKGSYSGSSATNSALGQTASASSSSQPASRANDGDNNTFWYTTNGNATGGWWQVDLGSSMMINSASVRWYTTSSSYRCSSFRIQGSNDGTTFANVFGPHDSSSDAQDQVYNFSPASNRYWRFLCETAVSSNYYVVREARVFEALGTYPQTPYYVTTNTNSINTSTWTGVSNFQTTQVTPTNTSLRYLVSFDGRTTWKSWNGSAWVTVAGGLNDLQTSGVTAATLSGLSSANWMSAGGINSDASQTLDFAIDLDSNSVSEAPSLSQISIQYVQATYDRVADDSNYDIRYIDSTHTTIKNNTGSSQDIKANILIP